MKNKSKAKEFFEGLGMTLSIIWMSPILICEEIKEHCEKKKKAKESKPEPLQFVCSECGENFETEAVEKGMRTAKSAIEEFTFAKPQQCPKCKSWRTLPKNADMKLYQGLWEMEEARNVVRKLDFNWTLFESPIDMGETKFKCTQCDTIFAAKGIKPHPNSPLFPARCPNCNSMRTLPASEELRNRGFNLIYPNPSQTPLNTSLMSEEQFRSLYEHIWLIMELAEKDRQHGICQERS